MGWVDPAKPIKTKHFVFHLSIKEVERTEGSETERIIRTITSATFSDNDLRTLFNLASKVLNVVEDTTDLLDSK